MTELSDDVRALFNGPDYAHVATVLPTGGPHSDHDQPYAMAQVRGRVTQRLEGEAAWAVIDRLSHKYTGQPYPLRTDRVVFLVDPEHALAQAYG